MNRFILRLAALTAVVFSPVVGLAQTGDLVGKFVVNGKPPVQKKLKVTKDNDAFGADVVDDQLRIDADGGIADVVVYVRTKVDAAKIGKSYDSLPPKVVMDNKGGRFVPHVVTVWLKHQTMTIGNPDKVSHNSNLQPPGDKGENPLLPPGGMHNFSFNRQQNAPVPVGCNIHPWMKAYVLPRENPYVAVSAEDGTFTIKELPVGELEFQLWHDPKFLMLDKTDKGKVKLTIKAGDNHLPMADKDGVVKVDIKLLEGK